jgi:hypothetical protein
MPTLREILDDTSYPLLTVIARQRGLTVPHNCSKSDLVALVHEALSDPERLQATLATLSQAERAVLEDLRVAGGHLPRYHLARRHGDLRRHRPWQDDAPARPWEDPQSPTERLYFLGLIFYHKPTRDLIIPTDLLDQYPAPERPAVTEEPTPGSFPTAMLAAHDLGWLLVLLDTTQTRLLHQRWLPPSFLHTWGERCTVSPAHPEAGSELQTERRRFLHFAAEAAGLVAPAGVLLKPTPAAWVWLAANPVERFGTLWEGTTAASNERWSRYRLPGHKLLCRPMVLMEAVLAALRHEVAQALEEETVTLDRLPDLSFGTPTAFAERILARDPEPRNDLQRPEILNADELLTRAIVALLEGPLRWLGAVTVGPEDGLHLTAWGAHWLHPRAPRPKPPPIAPFTLEPELVFAPPAGLPDLRGLATLATCGERLDDGRFQVTRERFVAALQRGHERNMLLARLNGIAQRPLSGTERARLIAWAEEAGRMVIRRLTVLEVDDPAILARLSGKRRGRSHIVRTLGRRAVAVDEGRLDVLVRRLTKQEGVPPQVELPPEEPPVDPSLGRGGAAQLWLAVKVYRALGRLVDLPVRLSHELVQHLASLAEPGALSASQVAYERAVAALEDAIQGRAAFPVWTETVLPVEESVALIEQALREGYALAMDYYTAGRDVVTHREVEPHRLEQRGKAMYLIGFCRRVQDERVFRVDRIRSLELVPLPEERYTGWDL